MQFAENFKMKKADVNIGFNPLFTSAFLLCPHFSVGIVSFADFESEQVENLPDILIQNRVYFMSIYGFVDCLADFSFFCNHLYKIILDFFVKRRRCDIKSKNFLVFKKILDFRLDFFRV